MKTMKTRFSEGFINPKHRLKPLKGQSFFVFNQTCYILIRKKTKALADFLFDLFLNVEMQLRLNSSYLLKRTFSKFEVDSRRTIFETLFDLSFSFSIKNSNKMTINVT